MLRVDYVRRKGLDAPVRNGHTAAMDDQWGPNGGQADETGTDSGDGNTTAGIIRRAVGAYRRRQAANADYEQALMELTKRVGIRPAQALLERAGHKVSVHKLHNSRHK